jgi:hypothetical protein
MSCPPRVLNLRDCPGGAVPEGAVYVGRPSKWGNPFRLTKGVDRARVIARYRGWLFAQPALVADVKRELRGKDLVCWCAPLACHADILLEVANEEKEAA